MAGFRKDAAEFRPGNNVHRSPEPVPSSSLPWRGRIASREHRVQCARQSVPFEIGATPDKREKEREAQRKPHLSTRAASAILPAGLLVSGGGASFPAADSS